MADIPTFLKGSYDENWDYHEQTQQVLLEAIGPNGFEVSILTRADVATITSRNFEITLPVGTMFFVKDYNGAPPFGAWAGIIVAAVPAISDATLVTFNTSPY